MTEVRRCRECGRFIALLHWPPYGIHLNYAWVHVSRFGNVKRRVNHKPVL